MLRRDRAGDRRAVRRRHHASPGCGRGSPPRGAQGRRAGRRSSRSPRSSCSASSNNWDIFVDYIGIVLVAVFLHDALALAARLRRSPARPRLPDRQRKAMTFEVGVRNAGLGLLLVFTYFDGLGGMALVAAWWGIWDIIAGLARRRVVWRRRYAGAAEPRWPHEGPGHRRQRLPRHARSSRGLAAAGHEVVSADLPSRRAARRRHVVMDVTSPAAVDAVIAEARPEVVVHLASIVTPGHGLHPRARVRRRRRPAPGTCSTPASPTAYAGSWCRRAARRTATTRTTRRGSPRTSRCAATRSSPTATTSGWSRRCSPSCAARTRARAGGAADRHDPRRARSTTRSPRSSSASGC